jgi:8-oxo-dGTP diphosphatase
MRVVVAAVIEREDRRLLIGQRRRHDTSPLKWEFPGGKIEDGEAPEAALARELREELGVTLKKYAEIARVTHKYADTSEALEIRFFAVEIADQAMVAKPFEQIAWVLPKELSDYDFLAANARLVRVWPASAGLERAEACSYRLPRK